VNLSYDVNSLFGAGYDWRLSMTALQDRDGYFTRLRKTIEGGVASNGGKAGIVGEKIKLHHNAATQRNATQHNATQHNATQHNTTTNTKPFSTTVAHSLGNTVFRGFLNWLKSEFLIEAMVETKASEFSFRLRSTA